MLKRLVLTLALLLLSSGAQLAHAQTSEARYEYKLLATNRVTTMEKELNDAAAQGFEFREAISGETAFGGNEVVIVMTRELGKAPKPRYQYRLLATSKTSTMEKELQEAGAAGFTHRDETVFKKVFGTEVTVIMERDVSQPNLVYDYKLLATRKTSTMQKELSDAGAQGYEFVGVARGDTFFGGTEVVSILRRPRQK